MNPTTLYGFFLVLALGLGGVLTSGTTQTTLFVSAVCALVALILTTVVELVGNRSRDRAREDYRARYGKYPSP